MGGIGSGRYPKMFPSNGTPVPTPPGKPKKPKGIPKEAAKLWDSVVPHLEACGLVGPTDASSLEGMCRWWAEYLAMCAMADADMEVTMKRSTAWKNYAAIANCFGLNPAARQKLPLKKQSKSPIQEMLERRQA